jgi:hypothetical protein
MNQPMTIRVEVPGHLSAEFAECLDPLHCEPQPTGGTVLSGTVPDQTAVHALCNRLRDLGIPITSLTVGPKGTAQ